MPDVHLMFYKNVIVFDHSNESVYVIAMNPDEKPEHILDERIANLKKALKPARATEETDQDSMIFEPEMDKQQFINDVRSEEHTSELQSRGHLVCRLLLEKKKQKNK